MFPFHNEITTYENNNKPNFCREDRILLQICTASASVYLKHVLKPEIRIREMDNRRILYMLDAVEFSRCVHGDFT